MSRMLTACVGAWFVVASGFAQSVVRETALFDDAVVRGDREAALRAGEDLLRKWCATPPDGVAEEKAAALLHRMATFAPDHPTRWNGLLKDLKGAGAFGARIASFRASAEAALGRFEEAEALASEAGFLRRFLLVGPFDNERGAGFLSPLDPERGPVDPSAEFDGKGRRVAWRVVDAVAPDGTIDFRGMTTPPEQALVFVAASLTVEEPTRLSLGVGATGSWVVFLNGVEVGRFLGRREFAADQAFAPLDLVAGSNELLVKIGAEDGPFTGALRLAGADLGPPPGDVRVSADVGAFGARPKTDANASRPKPVLPYAERAALAAADSNADAETLIRAIELRLALRLDDLAKPTTPETSARLLKLAPDLRRARELRAWSLRRVVTIAAERAENPRLRALESILELEPNHLPALVELARTFLEDLHQAPEAERRLKTALAARPDHAPALDLHARLLSERGRAGEALAAARAAARSGGVGDKLAYAKRLRSERRLFEAARAFDDVVAAASGVFEVATAASESAGERGLLEVAKVRAEAALHAAPAAPSARLRVVETAEAAGDLEGALAALERALAADPDNVDYLRRAALNADRLDRREAALDYVRRALVVLPGDAALRRYEGRLAGAEKAFDDFYPTDVVAIAQKAPNAEDNPEKRPYRVLFQKRIVKVNPDGTTGDYLREVVQILSQQGADAYDRVFVRFMRGEQRPRVRSARLLRPGEEPVDATRYGQYGADFPPLRVGDVVDWAYRVDDLRPSFFGDYVGLRHHFQDFALAETLKSEFILLTPKERTFRTHVRNGVGDPETIEAPPFLNDYVARRYVVENLPAIAVEPAMPSPEEFTPEVQVSSYADWDAFTTWWWNLIKDQYDVSDAMRAKLEEILEGKTTDEEKLRAIYDFVVTDVRYVAWEFGVHGYKPYRASAIFDRRFGDCKDKALLINALLSEIGLKGYPVLIRAEGVRPSEDHALALVEHFNHCIAAIPTGDGGYRFLDGTAEFHAAEDLPDSDRGARVVVVEEGRAVPVVVPHATPEENGVDETLEVALRADGSATAVLKTSVRGRNAVDLRSTFVNEADRKEILGRRLTSRFGAGDVVAESFSPLSDLSTPVSAEWTFAIKDALLRDGARARLRPLWPSFDWTTLAAAPERRFDLVLGEPFKSATSARVKLPPELRPIDKPRDVSIDVPFASFTSTRTIEGDVLVLRRELVLKRPRVPAADYESFRQFVTQVAAADAETVVLEAVR
jgi:cellulose synthase operon protein C